MSTQAICKADSELSRSFAESRRTPRNQAFRWSFFSIVLLQCFMAFGGEEEPAVVAEPETPPAVREIGGLEWHTDYSAAYREAKENKKQLLILLMNPKRPIPGETYIDQVLAAKELKEPLEEFVRAVLPTTALAPAKEGEEPKPLLDHEAFEFMYEREGIAIIDLEDSEKEFYGQVVSAHPFQPGKHYTIHSTKIVLGLPRGTITQRTLVYALRIHPEAPASAFAEPHPYLFDQAHVHSKMMSQYQSVGHHDWGTRYQRIASKIGAGPSEVAAMSWGSSSLIESAKECVGSWRGSGAHWGMIAARQGYFGYDMVKSPNGHWYATGIFTGKP